MTKYTARQFGIKIYNPNVGFDISKFLYIALKYESWEITRCALWIFAKITWPFSTNMIHGEFYYWWHGRVAVKPLKMPIPHTEPIPDKRYYLWGIEEAHIRRHKWNEIYPFLNPMLDVFYKHSTNSTSSGYQCSFCKYKWVKSNKVSSIHDVYFKLQAFALSNLSWTFVNKCATHLLLANLLRGIP